MSQAGVNNNQIIPPSVPLFLEGDSGGQVGPDGASTIFLLGGDNVTVVGNPGTNTLLINTEGTEVTVQTTDATPTLIGSITVDSGESIVISMEFTALENDLSTALGGDAFTVARNAGGGAQLSGGVHQSMISNTPGFPEITVGVSGNDVQLFVTGAAATTLDWRMLIKVLLSS